MVTRSLVGIAAIIMVVFLGLGVGTILMSIIRRRRDKATEEAREAVYSGIFSRLDQEDPAWGDWVTTLDKVERANIRYVLDELLREVTGSDREVLLDLARFMGIGEEAKKQIQEGSIVDRQIALTWVALLDVPIEHLEIVKVGASNQALRETGARVFYERDESLLGASEWGTRLLLWEGKDELGVSGLETLYRLNRQQAPAILAQGSSYAPTWQPNLAVQVLTVLSKCQTTRDYERFDWVIKLTSHPDPDVRAAAIETFSTVGWKREFRENLDLRAFVTDQSPDVRQAAYRMLGAWGDELAANWLTIALSQETDERARLEAFRILYGLGVKESDIDADYPDYWAWVRSSRSTEAEMDPVVG